MNTVEFFLLVWAVVASVATFYFWRKSRQFWSSTKMMADIARHNALLPNNSYRLPLIVMTGAFIILAVKHLQSLEKSDGGEGE